MTTLAALVTAGTLLYGPAQSDINQQGGKAPLPTQPPSVILVAPFAVDADLSGADGQDQQQSGGLLPRPLGILGRRHQNPQEAAQELANGMARLMVNALGEDGINAAPYMPGGEVPPGAWIYNGEFTEIDEGGNVRRAVIGFGAGEATMALHTWVTEAGGEPFLLFTDKTGSGHMPGAEIAKFNPYVIAAKLVLSKKAPEKDAKNAAGMLAKKLAEWMKQHNLMPAAAN